LHGSAASLFLGGGIRQVQATATQSSSFFMSFSLSPGSAVFEDAQVYLSSYSEEKKRGRGESPLSSPP
jgi:hypothetical protein